MPIYEGVTAACGYTNSRGRRACIYGFDRSITCAGGKRLFLVLYSTVPEKKEYHRRVLHHSSFTSSRQVRHTDTLPRQTHFAHNFLLRVHQQAYISYRHATPKRPISQRDRGTFQAKREKRNKKHNPHLRAEKSHRRGNEDVRARPYVEGVLVETVVDRGLWDEGSV